MTPGGGGRNGRGRPLGVGIIGCGAISSLHAASFSSLRERARVVAFADIEDGRASEMRRRFRADAAYAEYACLLERPDIDVVSVCTPPATHAEIVVDAIEAGKHVLCEKPIATTLED